MYKISEKIMHRVRWGLALGWLLLIVSLFYDPITPRFTQPGSNSPFALDPNVYTNPDLCVKIRDLCIPEQPFSLSVLMWWAMIVPAGILILMTFGHELWRRICPLSFFSQIPRALGIQRRKKVRDPLTGESSYEVVKIKEDSWLGRNHLYFQWGLFTLGLGARILFVNGDRYALGWFLIGTIACAIIVGYLYAGKSWCQYFCPMAPVQMVYTGPRSLLGSEAHTFSKPTITQSMCRLIDPETGDERSACVQCKAPCIDIDSEQTYWSELKKPGRRLVQYGYIGMVISFYFYYFLYSGNWDYYFTGAWTHEETLTSRLFDPGFYIHGVTIPIPKFIAVFMTYGIFTAATFLLGLILEKLYRRIASTMNGKPVSAEQAQHTMFTIFTLASFWVFFSYGARPSLNRLPEPMILGFNALVVLVGAIWFYRTVSRKHDEYEREKVAASLRKQLRKLNPPVSALKGREIDDLSATEVYTLVNALTAFSKETRVNAYAGIVQDLLEQGVLDPSDTTFCTGLREKLNLKDEDHFATLQKIAQNQPELLVPKTATIQTSDLTLARPVSRDAATMTIPILKSRNNRTQVGSLQNRRTSEIPINKGKD
ncbi:hypothetical protein ACQ4M3_07485 [Leptolyngbya sp. AN03gr2]